MTETWTPADYATHVASAAKRGGKYNARKCVIDDYTFDSRAEAQQYLYLRDLAGRGKITRLEVHPSFVLVDPFTVRGVRYRAITYHADFAYREIGAALLTVEDVKGGKATRTPTFEIKRKLFMLRYGATHQLNIVEY